MMPGVDEIKRRRSTLNSAQKAKLRVLQAKGSRIAVSLEAIFWSTLDDIAQQRRISTSKLVFDVLAENAESANRASLLRCFCLDALRANSSTERLQSQSFDMLGIIAACPTPVAVITAERKIVTFNPSFNVLINRLRSNEEEGTAIKFSFSESVPRIQQALIQNPRRIPLHHVGVLIGNGQASYFQVRFALADRAKAEQSLILMFFEGNGALLKPVASTPPAAEPARNTP